MNNFIKFYFLLIFLQTSAFCACNINNYNSGATCSQVSSALNSAIRQSENYFKNKRRSMIEDPTRTLSNKMEQYSKLTGVLMSYNQSIYILRKNIAYLNEKNNYYEERNSALDELNLNVFMLENQIQILENSLKLER